ncbi:MAG: peptide deformylase [Pseudomonadota bacterium]
MSLLTILEFPDPRLRTVAKPVTDVDDEVRELVSNMFDTMYAAPGIGLAATQVDVHRQILVTDVSENRDQPYCLINPEIISGDGVTVTEEGCLSVPGIYAKVERYETITVKALNEQGEEFTLDADGMLAICIQHEMDHLKGKLFVDYLSDLKRQRIRKRLEKERRFRSADDAARATVI